MGDNDVLIAATQCKSPVARANRLAADRFDLQFACHKFSTHAANFSAIVWKKLKRLAQKLKQIFERKVF